MIHQARARRVRQLGHSKGKGSAMVDEQPEAPLVRRSAPRLFAAAAGLVLLLITPIGSRRGAVCSVLETGQGERQLSL